MASTAPARCPLNSTSRMDEWVSSKGPPPKDLCAPLPISMRLLLEKAAEQSTGRNLGGFRADLNVELLNGRGDADAPMLSSLCLSLAEGVQGRALPPHNAPPPASFFLSFPLFIFFYIVSDLFFHSIILKDSGL